MEPRAHRHHQAKPFCRGQAGSEGQCRYSPRTSARQMPPFASLFPTCHNKSLCQWNSRSVGERKVMAIFLCPCSTEEFQWLNPLCAVSHPKVLKGFYQFSFKWHYLFLHQIFYEELTFGLAAMTSQGNIICPFLYHDDNTSTVGIIDTIRKWQKVGKEMSSCHAEQTATKSILSL